MVDIIYGHVVDVVVKPEKGVHLLTDLTCLYDLLEPFLHVLSREPDLPAGEPLVLSLLILDPEPFHHFSRLLLPCLTDSVIVDLLSLLTLILLLHLVINQHHILKPQ